MKANEFRLGNLIMSDDEIFPVTMDVFRAFQFPDIINEYQPIPLTEEWLLKFGFNKIHEDETYDKIKVSYIDDEYAYWKPGLYLLSKNGDRWCFYRYTDEDTGFEIHSNIEYVHQLQNLYFALTNTELELKGNSD